MKTYKFYVRSTRGGFTEWVCAYIDGVEVHRIDRDVYAETVREFRERVGSALEAEGFVYDARQYSL